jgi:hypothetical protein
VTALPGVSQPRFAAPARFEHAFYAAVALALLALVAAGFAPTFFARDVEALGPLSSAVLVHGIAGTTWLLLFICQIALVATRRVALHRRLGFVAAAVAAVFVASGVLVIANLEAGHGSEPLTWRAPHLFTNGAPLTSFALLVAAGIWQRATAARHKRLMLLAAVVLAPPAIGRWFAELGLAELNFVAYAVLAFACAAFDWLAYGRPHVVSLLGAAALVAIDAVTTMWLAAVGS